MSFAMNTNPSPKFDAGNTICAVKKTILSENSLNFIYFISCTFSLNCYMAVQTNK